MKALTEEKIMKKHIPEMFLNDKQEEDAVTFQASHLSNAAIGWLKAGIISAMQEYAALHAQEQPTFESLDAQVIMMKHCSDNGLLNYGLGRSILAAMTDFAALAVAEATKDQKDFTDWCIYHVWIEPTEEKYVISNETTIYSFEDLKDYWAKYISNVRKVINKQLNELREKLGGEQ